MRTKKMRGLFLLTFTIMILGAGFRAEGVTYHLTADGKAVYISSGGDRESFRAEPVIIQTEEDGKYPAEGADSDPPYVVIIDCMPHPGQGIDEDTLRVRCDTAVIVRLQDDTGVAADTVGVSIDGEPVISLLLKQVRTGDLTDYWVICPAPGEGFGFDRVMEVSVEASDVTGNEMESPFTFEFKTENLEEHEWARGPASVTAIDYYNPFLEKNVVVPDYDDPFSGWIEGAVIIYDLYETVPPRFGPIDEIPDLDLAVGASYAPLLIDPPTVFSEPITVYVPCPDALDVNRMEVYYYNPAVGWEEAGNIAGWMVPESRVNHGPGDPVSTDPPSIEIMINHGGGIQIGGNEEDVSRCFIAAAAFGSPLNEEVKLLRRFRDRYLQKHPAGAYFVRLYYRYSPPIARLISQRPVMKRIIRTILKPAAWMIKNCCGLD